MSNVRTFIVTTLLLLLAAGCTSNFLITKDGKSYFFGSRDDAIYKMLCESGDLKMILDRYEIARQHKSGSLQI